MNNFRLLSAEETEVRISQCGSWGIQLLLYMNARAAADLMDYNYGMENWQCKYEVINGNLFCSIGVRVVREDGSAEWIWRSNVGTESNTEKEKGEASDAFKRCVSLFGNRELYSAPSIFVRPENLKTLEEKNGRWTCRDRFKVTDIQYCGKKIASVTIQNEKTGKQLTFTNDIPNGMTEASLKPEKKAQELKSIYTREWLMKYGKECIGRDEINQILAVTEGKTGSESLEGILRSVKKNDVSELNYLQFVSIMAHFKKLAA